MNITTATTSFYERNKRTTRTKLIDHFARPHNRASCWFYGVLGVAACLAKVVLFGWS